MAKTGYNIIEITQSKTGVTYLYEDYSYWNSEKGYSTHKRKSIGKIDESGNRIYNSYYLEKLAAKARGENVEERRINPTVKAKTGISTVVKEQTSALHEDDASDSPVVSTTVLLGQKMVLDKACETTRLRKALSSAFAQEETDSILALAYYTVCQGKAFSRSADWLVERGYADLGLTSQSISVLLAQLTDDKVNTFFKAWIGQQTKGDSMLFDITSVSTYGKGNLYAERGYNRDHENLEQINMSLLTSVTTGLPMWYCITPGSMSDVVVLKYVLKMLDKLGISKFTFYGDRGFYSADNLQMITKRGHKFTVPVPSSVSWQKDMLSENKATMLSPRNVIELEDGSIIYGKTIYRMSEYGRTYYHIYFDPTRKNKIVNDFMHRLQRCKCELEANEEFEKNKHMYETYFIVKDTPKRGRVVEYNDKAIQEFIDNDSCYWILMSTAEKDTKTALMSYRQRNDVEICFDDIKNSMDMRRMRNHTEKTIKGKVFVVFIALVLLTQLRMMVQKIPLKERKYWSEYEFLEKVASYTKVHFANKYKDVYTIPTANQRLAFDLLDIDYQGKKTVKEKETDSPSDDNKGASDTKTSQEVVTQDSAC